MKKRTIIGLFFLFLFCIYWCGISCFTHSHVENGVIIVHSHPFKDSHHHHTHAQYETIFYVTHFFSQECSTSPLEISARIIQLPILYILVDMAIVVLCKRGTLYLRAPPSFSL